MEKKLITITGIPAIIWGPQTERVYIAVHGKHGNKEEAESLAEKATAKGFQVLSFDLPEHGERAQENYPCVVWNCIRDLHEIGKYATERWESVSLFANSMGAYFSMLAYKDMSLEKSLFLSPILDMERLIRNMMTWSGVTEAGLREKKEIPTSFGETLNWDYYAYIRGIFGTHWCPYDDRSDRTTPFRTGILRSCSHKAK